MAAANPLFGRYDKSKSLKNNLDISAPIMSRFDLFFILIDQCDQATDHRIANYILKLNKDGEEAIKEATKYTS